MLQGYKYVLIGMTALIIPAVTCLAYSCRAKNVPLWALGLLLGGAVGNLYDRIFHGGVRDFIDVNLGFWPFNPWPIFNVADTGIVVGVVAYLVWSLFFAPPEKPPSSSEEAPRAKPDQKDAAETSP